MAEGIQKKIEYADLQFISSFAMEKILDFQIWEEPGEHARGNFRLLLSENETGINSMDAPIQLLGQGAACFSGKNRTGRRGGHLYIPPCGKQLWICSGDRVYPYQWKHL